MRLKLVALAMGIAVAILVIALWRGGRERWPQSTECPGGPPSSAQQIAGIPTIELQAGRPEPVSLADDLVVELTYCALRGDEAVRRRLPAPHRVRPQTLPPFVQRALEQMRFGETRRFWVPTELPDRPAIWPQGPLVVDVTVERAPKPQPAPGAPPAEPPHAAHQTSEGLAWVILQHGTREPRPTPSSEVELAMKVWSKERRLIKNIPTSQPLRMNVGALFYAAAQVVMQMTPGETRRLWILAPLTTALPPGWPREALIIDLTLVSVGS